MVWKDIFRIDCGGFRCVEWEAQVESLLLEVPAMKRRRRVKERDYPTGGR